MSTEKFAIPTAAEVKEHLLSVGAEKEITGKKEHTLVRFTVPRSEIDDMKKKAGIPTEIIKASAAYDTVIIEAATEIATDRLVDKLEASKKAGLEEDVLKATRSEVVLADHNKQTKVTKSAWAEHNNPQNPEAGPMEIYGGTSVKIAVGNGAFPADEVLAPQSTRIMKLLKK